MLHLKSFLFLSLVLCSIALPCPFLPLAHFISCLSAKPHNPIVHVALSLYLPYLPTYLPDFSIKFFDQEDQVCKERKRKRKKRRRDVPGGVEKNETKRNEKKMK